MEEKKNKGGRPRIQLDWNQIDLYLESQSTIYEIAKWCRCSVDTLERACKRDNGVPFSEYSEDKREAGKCSLRRAQWQKAVEKLDSTMLIWLGKQYLNQRDTKDIKAQVEQTTIPQLEAMTAEELKALLGEPDDIDINGGTN